VRCYNRRAARRRPGTGSGPPHASRSRKSVMNGPASCRAIFCALVCGWLRRVNPFPRGVRHMRIAAMAAGAVGGYFGARMAAAGHDVFFIARGANRDAIQKNGLKIASVHGDLHLRNPNVTDDPAKVGPVDVVLFAVKLWDTETAAAAARPLLGPESRLITFQNGVDSVDRISGVLGADRVIGGAAAIASTIASPGVIKHTSQFASIRF